MSVVSRLSDMTRSTSLGIMRRRRLFSSIVVERCVSSICECECSIVISYGGPMPGLYGEAMRSVRQAHPPIYPENGHLASSPSIPAEYQPQRLTQI